MLPQPLLLGLLVIGAAISPVLAVEFDIWLKRRFRPYRRFKLIGPQTGFVSVLCLLGLFFPWGYVAHQVAGTQVRVLSFVGAAVLWVAYHPWRMRRLRL